ncbi:MAG TPA: SRPBCC family protein [Verrucomicrobiae bacterium]|nr:SRPBCC family protein [Verrucomicrobiae bacterium]
MTVAKTGERQIVITREFDAPRALVFRAMTDPAVIPLWWGPARYTTTIDKLDARPGGAWRFVQKGPDGEFGFRGVFKEIVPPQRVVMTFEWEGLPGHISVNTLVLEERGGRTFMTSTSTFDSREDRDGMVESGMESGARESYDRLDTVLATL